jgi:hypothetical protein
MDTNSKSALKYLIFYLDWQRMLPDWFNLLYQDENEAERIKRNKISFCKIVSNFKCLVTKRLIPMMEQLDVRVAAELSR